MIGITLGSIFLPHFTNGFHFPSQKSTSCAAWEMVRGGSNVGIDLEIWSLMLHQNVPKHDQEILSLIVPNTL